MKFSIVSFQTVINASYSMRFDAEFFRPDYLEIQEFLKQDEYLTLADFQVSIRHPQEIKRNYESNGILFLRAQNVRPCYINTLSNPVFISCKDAEKLDKNTIENKNVLLTRTGANFGQCAIYLDDTDAIASSHTFIINSGNLNPFLLTVFLNTRYGRKMIDKGMYGGSQPEIAPYFLYQIPIPVFGHIQHLIEKVYLQSHNLIQQSRNIYVQAQTLILSELSLTDWQPKQQLYFVKNYSEVKQAKRIDAEYYQPKYDEIIKVIKSYSGGWDTLENLVTIKKCIEPGSNAYLDEGIPFIRVSNLSPFEITKEKYISEELYVKIKKHQPGKGEILFSKDATPGIAHYLSEEPQKMIPSSGILRLISKTDKINSEYLTLVLNSVLVKEQINRDVGGSVILHWRPDQVRKTIIPVLPKKKQFQIQQKISESFRLRKQSRYLLTCAKQAVEMAIAQDEQAAIKWLEHKTKETTGASAP